MRIINGINYHYKLNQIIKECYNEASSHPFETFIFIADNPKVIEKLFLRHTHCLVNIEVMSFSSFLQQQMIENHLTKHHVLSQLELTYHIRHILNHEDLSCFTNQHVYPLIEKLIPLIKDYDYNDIEYSKLENFKLNDFMSIYQSLKERCDMFTHITMESIFDDCDFHSGLKKHIYIEGDHLYQKKRQDIMKRLSMHHDVTIMYTHTQDQRLFNLPYHSLCIHSETISKPEYLLDNLFMQTVQPSLEDKAYYTFISSTLHQEVKQVVYNIYQKIVDENLHYSDFMIVYPDSSYIELIRNTLEDLNIPHHIPFITSGVYDYSFQYILECIDTIQASTISEYAKILNNEDLDSSYHQYLESLLNYHDPISQEEFKQFFLATCSFDQIEVNRNQDYVSVCSLEEALSDNPLYVYILGMNETILPHSIKDTALLLDEDILLLRELHKNTPLLTLEQLGVHYNDILKLLSQESKSMTFSYSLQTLSGETLLPSSLYKQLNTMFHLKKQPPYHFLPLDEYYQQGGEVLDKEQLNHNIKDYIQSKNQPIQLSKETVQSLYSPHLSVSQIETYNKCPFSYFIQYGLGIYPLKEDNLMPNELGSLVHYVLSICIDKDEDINQLVDQFISQDIFLSKKINNSSINQYFIEQLKKDLEITIQVARRQLSLSRFKVKAKEEKITDDILGMNFKGFVDRIDVFNDLVTIVDYKSSAKDIDLNLAMQGFNIQMLLYLKMVTKSYQKDPGAVLYFNTKKRILSLNQSLQDKIEDIDFYKQYRYGGYVIDDSAHSSILALDPQIEGTSDIINVRYVKTKDSYKGHLLDKKELEILLDIIEKHIYELYQQMLDGHIEIAPKGSDNASTHALISPCTYCPYHSVCSFDVFYNDYTLVESLDVDKMLGGDEDAV